MQPGGSGWQPTRRSQPPFPAINTDVVDIRLNSYTVTPRRDISTEAMNTTPFLSRVTVSGRSVGGGEPAQERIFNMCTFYQLVGTPG